MKYTWLLACTALGCAAAPAERMPVPAQNAPDAARLELRDPREVHFAELEQLTFGGENAEAYWSFRGDQLIFQSTRPPYTCDQIFRMPASGPGEPVRVSTGKGRTTCSYFLPGDAQVIYSSSHLASEACPPAPDRSHGYVWPLDDYDVFTARADGSELRRLTETPGYDAESTVCPRDGSIVFTSIRDGDLELYRMDSDGKNVRRLTSTPGYDGGAFFSPDCTRLVWRASRPRPGKELDDYKALLARRLVRPTRLELMVANADGSEARQITYLGVASFGPSFYPDGQRVIFASNLPDPRGREFDIWAVNVDGTALERLTFSPGFDGFPLFSPDGSRLAFSSNRHQQKEGDTNVFVARFVDGKREAVAETGADRVARDIAWLSDDARDGRGLGSAGLAEATSFIEKRFAQLGLEPLAGSHRHSFDVTVRIRSGPKTALAIDAKAAPPEAFVPASFSSSGTADGRVVVAGYGISAPELKVDDYRGVPAKDAIVVVRRFTPEAAPFDKSDAERRYGDLRYKAWVAREHGARGLIVVDAPRAARGAKAPEDAPLPKLEADPSGDAGIPVVIVTRALGEPLLQGGHRSKIDVELVRDHAPAHNVVGRLAASSQGKLDGVIVIGAHYDHLGRGGPGSMQPGSSEVHNGADDNASGTAALLEVGRVLSLRRAELKRDVVLVAFSGEETGVLGSSAFVRAPPAGLSSKQFVAMLNMDMVGRMRENRLAVLAAESSDAWPGIVEPVCDKRRVGCAVGGEGFGPSDHSPFYAAGIPVLHFFTGAHADYHKPSDDAARINAAGAAEIAALVSEVALAVAARSEKPAYKSAPVPAPVRGDTRSAGASLGSIPDYSETGVPGVKLSGVRPGGAGDKAGLKAGDRIVKIGKTEIRSIYDLEFVLRRAKPGEQTSVVYERDGKRHEVQVTFGERTRR